MTKKNKTVEHSFFTERANNANRKEIYHFDEKKGHSITYFPKFSQTKKDRLIKELLETMAYCNKENINYFTSDAEIEQYTGYLIIKHFTSLFDTLSSWSVEKNIEYMTGLYDSGDFELFFEDIFSNEEVTKVFEQLKRTNDITLKYTEELLKQQSIINNKVSTDFLKNKALSKLSN